MYHDGYKNIVNIDYSPVVIEKMKQRHQNLVEMQYLVMDITKMTFDKNSFDVVIEKATLDALLVDEKHLWNPSDHSRTIMHTVLFQVFKARAIDNGKHPHRPCGYLILFLPDDLLIKGRVLPFNELNAPPCNKLVIPKNY
jgi:SAM-dependent methyltransferase